MSFFLITIASDSEKQLHVLTFDCEIDEKNVVALVFTSRHSAEDYIEMAGWKNSHSIEQIEPTELLKCLILAKSRGVTHVAVEPKRNEQLNGQVPKLLVLENAYDVHADLLHLLQKELGVLTTGGLQESSMVPGQEFVSRSDATRWPSRSR